MNDEQQKTPEAAQWAFTGGEEPLMPADHVGTISWSASEYISHEKSPGWFAGITSAATAVSALIFILTEESLASITILIVAFSAMFFAGRKPDVKQYELSDIGLKVDGKRHELDQFRSFSIVDEGAIDSIWLKPLGRFVPMLIIYFSPEDEERIIEALSSFLPHEQRELDPLDRLTRRLRF
jgi:hypothetical protein